MSFAAGYFSRLRAVLAKMPVKQLDRAYEMLERARRQRRRVFVMGNGGSAATASHFACDLGKGVGVAPARKFRVNCLNDSVPVMTACANDAGYEESFRLALEGQLERGDLVLGISTSGRSENVLRAVAYAKARGARTLAFTADMGGPLADLADCAVVTPTDDVQLAEDAHHSLCHMLMRRFCHDLGIPPSGKPR